MRGPVDTGRKKIWGLDSNVFFLGVVSFLTDISSEIIFTIVPLLLFNVLGATTLTIGAIGGVSESADAIFRIISGWFSDKAKKRKPLTLLGYGISTIAKPFMLLAASSGSVLAVRFGDRVGKGIRTSPRDALLAESMEAGERGKGFGMHRAMDTFGAVLGLAIAAIVIYLVQGGELELGLGTYHRLVLVGMVPAVLAVLVLLFLVHEVKSSKVGSRQGVSFKALSDGFSRRFKIFLVIMAVFTLGNSSDFFVILRAQNLGSPVINVVLMLVLFNVTYAAVSLPAGRLSDRLGRRRVMIIGWFVYAAVYIGFASASSLWQVWLLFGCYGIYYGVTEGVARAFVADLVPEGKRGTAYGLYHGVVGLTLLPASLIAGWLWDAFSPAAPFYFGAGFAFLAMLGIMALVRE